MTDVPDELCVLPVLGTDLLPQPQPVVCDQSSCKCRGCTAAPSCFVVGSGSMECVNKALVVSSADDNNNVESRVRREEYTQTDAAVDTVGQLHYTQSTGAATAELTVVRSSESITSLTEPSLAAGDFQPPTIPLASHHPLTLAELARGACLWNSEDNATTLGLKEEEERAGDDTEDVWIDIDNEDLDDTAAANDLIYYVAPDQQPLSSTSASHDLSQTLTTTTTATTTTPSSPSGLSVCLLQVG